MSKSFLQRFQGKTQLVGKTGVQNILGTKTNTTLQSTNSLSKNYLRTYTNQTRHTNKMSQECSVYLPTKASLADTHFSSQTNQSLNHQSDIIPSKKSPQFKRQNQAQSGSKNQQNTMNHQKTHKGQNVRKWSKLGGLGANIGGQQWQKRKSKMQKMQLFSGQVKTTNSDKIRPIKHEVIKERQRQQRQDNCRTKALEYSKNIPKPHSKLNQQYQQEIQQCIEPYEGCQNPHKVVFNNY